MSIFKNDEEFSAYCREVSANYFTEEEEYKQGIHPTQILDKIKKNMYENGDERKIKDIDWHFRKDALNAVRIHYTNGDSDIYDYDGKILIEGEGGN